MEWLKKDDLKVYCKFDNNKEKKVVQEIEKQVGDNILILISNKITMMEKMDKVFLLIDGKIINSGTHNELLENSQIYNELSNYEKVGDLGWKIL